MATREQKFETRKVQAEIPADILAKLRDTISKMTWVRAKSYDDTFPHEYGQKRRISEDMHPAFLELATAIPTYGYRRTTKGLGTWTYLDIDGYSYWIGWQPPEYHDWINRVKTDEAAVWKKEETPQLGLSFDE